MKVYCKNCKYIVKCGIRGIHLRCAAGKKEKDFYGTTWYHDSCKNKNKNCDCKDYHRKWWKFWT